MNILKEKMAQDQCAWDLDRLKKRDLHVHTKYCRHAEGSMEDYVRAAVDRGLGEIGFLEHIEANTNSSRRIWLTDEELDLYWETGLALREQYAGRIHVSLGLEVGVHPEALEGLKKSIARHPWDRLGLSCHFVPNGEGLVNISSQYCIPELETANHRRLTILYYQTLLTYIPTLKPYMICHLDLPRKYLKDLHYDPEIKSLVRHVLWEMGQEQVKLEINTGGYGMVGAPYPASWILTEALAMGLEPVLCSDSHKPEQVGRHYDQAVDYIIDSLEETA